MSGSNFYFFVDSRNKIYGSNTDFSISESDFNLEPGVNVSVAVDECIFYNTQYPINSSNNTIVFQENSTPVDLTATLVPGNYTGSELATELQTQLIAAGANTYTVSYNNSTGKLTISVTLPDTIKLITINDIYGFSAGTTFLSAITADNIAVLSGVEYVDLLLPSLVNNNITTSDSNTNGITKRIPLDLPWGSLIVYKSEESDESVIVEKQYLNNIRVRLLNPDGSTYNLSDNTHLSLSLKCKYQF